MSSRSASSAASLRAALAVGGLVFLLAFLVRATDAPRVFRGGSPQIGPFDDLYHAARIIDSARHPGHVLNFDANRGLHGAFCPWPPLYDLCAGAAARLLGGSTPNAILSRAVWFPPLAASVFAALIAFGMARRHGAFAGFLTGAGVGFSSLVTSRIGDIDHHFLEPILLFGIIGATALLRRARRAPDVVRLGSLLGLALMAALFVQTALLIAAAVSLLAVLLLPRDAIAPRWAAALGFGIAALAVGIYRLSQPAGYPESSWYLGLSHAAALFAAAVACAVSAIALERRAPAAGALLSAVAIGTLSVAWIPSVVQDVVGGIGFFRGDPWLRTIDEFQPLFVQGWPGLFPAFCKVGGGALLLLPLALSAARRRDSPRFVLALFGVVYLLASLSSQRFLVCARPLLMVIGALVVWGWRRRPAAAIAGILLLLAPTLWFDLRVVRDTPDVNEQTLPFFRAAGTLRSRSRSPRRVLPPWSWGHVVEIVGAQAPVVDGFGSSIGPTDFENALGSILMASEEHVADYCRWNGIRYLVLENPIPRLLDQAVTIGLSPDFFLEARPGRRERILPLMRFSFWWRAYFDRGGEVREPGRFAPALSRFQLIYSDPQPSGNAPGFRGPAVQVWELVESSRGPDATPGAASSR